MSEASPQIALPGQLLPKSTSTTPRPTTIAGSGTHYFHPSAIHASLAGIPRITQPSKSRSATAISVSAPPKTLLPAVGALVLARVIRTTPRQATVDILAVSEPLSSPLASNTIENDTNASNTNTTLHAHYTPFASSASEFQALIRQQDIRATEKDKVKVSESFRPGDVVRAVVISLGDQRDYYLSTAGYVPEDGGGAGRKIEGNELGVVVATSERGNAMVPVSWRECKDPVTGFGELRKVARPG